ncbi:uncharacterized protein LOC116935529 isoform X2 [Daphnia magna]|uniref:uncharacterized protein LOC116935529 isoform X2 n=1 Tax=Daphnia magna TaxID=35525 RepID=UPI001E1BA18F|nr:uncharacterized protein LOC116935529 isoform X2 [Daphnia magna]
MTSQRFNPGRHKKTLKRRATTAVDADYKLKVLRTAVVENADEGAVSEVEQLVLMSTGPAAENLLDRACPDDEFDSAEASAIFNVTDSGSRSQASRSESTVLTDYLRSTNAAVLKTFPASTSTELELSLGDGDEDEESLNSDDTDDEGS